MLASRRIPAPPNVTTELLTHKLFSRQHSQKVLAFPSLVEVERNNVRVIVNSAVKSFQVEME